MIETMSRLARPPIRGRTLAIWGICTVLAAAAGPFGTYQTAGFAYRLLYWGMVIVTSTLIAQLCHGLARQVCGRSRPVQADLTMAGLMALLFTPVLWGLTHGLFPLAGLTADGYATMALYVALVTAAVCVARRVLPGFEKVGYFGAAAERSGQPRLMQRLPDEATPPILRLSGRDHHVEVVTASGSYVVRMRFADAIAEMDSVTGHCAHRSHWVARAAIASVEREGARIQLRLVNDDLIPVSRKYRPDLEAAGVI